MNDTKQRQSDDQLELLLTKNRELIDALNNLRRRLRDEPSECTDEVAALVEAEKKRKREEIR